MLICHECAGPRLSETRGKLKYGDAADEEATRAGGEELWDKRIHQAMLV